MQSECKVKVGTLCRYLTSHGCEHWSLKQAIRLTGTPQTTATMHHCLQSAHEECHYVGKHNYSRGVVQEIYIHDNMVPSLRRLVPKLQTKSWKGISGHGVAVDGYQEKVNNAAERIVGRVVTEARVLSEVPKLNVTIPISRHLHTALQPLRDPLAPHTGLPTFENDVQVLVGFFRNMIGVDWAACCGESDDNLMTGRPGIQEVQRSPWHRLQAQQQDTRQHAIDVVANIRF